MKMLKVSNFAEFAQSCGGFGIRVEDPKKLDQALQKAIKANTPSLIEIIVDPDKTAASTKKTD